MLFKRRIHPLIAAQMLTPEIVVLTGMRRVGKTTALRMIFEEIESTNKVFLDIENPLDQKIFEEADYNNIWHNLQAYGLSSKEKVFIFLDEIQASPSIVTAIKYLHDHYDVKFFLTGSSSFYLKNLFSESLAGRKIIFELYPLDFSEFMVFKGYSKEFHDDFASKDTNKNRVVFEKTKKLYEEYLEFGGFPQVVLTDDYKQKLYQLNDIFKSYFEMEVQRLADFKQINKFRDLLLLLLQRTGSKLEITKLASEIGASRDTVYSYLAFLQGTYFVDLVPPYTRNRDREVSGAKKVYFCDNGFIHHFGRVSDGSLLENSAYLNLRKYGAVMYYQKRSGPEIDFILPEQNVALEVKKTGTDRDYHKLISVSRSLGFESGYVITQEFNESPGFIPTIEL
jgi:uncharacterized protein